MSAFASLEAALRAVEPSVRLVRERHLRRLLSRLRDRGRPLPFNPSLPLWVDRAEAVDADALPPGVLVGDEPRLLLLSDPDDRQVDHLPQPELLREYWRLLFQGAVLAAVDAKMAGGVDPAERLGRLPAAAVREVGFVLESDHRVEPDATASELYRAFAAAYLDLRLFAPGDVREVFPSLPDPAAVDRVLAADVPASQLRQAARPAGAAGASGEPRAHRPRRHPRRPEPLTPNARQALLAAADLAAGAGNDVRAAILRTRAAVRARAEDWQRADASARAALRELVGKTAAVLGWDGDARRAWEQALAPLLPLAADRALPPAARCLFELQKIPADLSGELYAVDLIEWARTLGRRPVVRPLTRARDVIILRRLHKAHRLLLAAGLAAADRDRLDRLLHDEAERVDHRIREDLGPVIAAALEDAGLRPATRVEEVARDKLVAELLDRLCERGQLRMADVRDAIARNRLKMDDLAGPVELVRGDALLRADTRLGVELDGVYRRGEVYLRWIQRGCSLFFGTPAGRLLSLYLLLPFGAAFMTLVFGNYLLHEGEAVYRWVSRQVVSAVAAADPSVPAPEEPPDSGYDPDASDVPEAPPSRVERLAEWAAGVLAARVVGVPVWAVLAFGLFLEGVFHVRRFRSAVLGVLGPVGRAVRFVFLDLPARLLSLPAVRLALDNVAVRWFRRRLLMPLVLTAAAALFLVVFRVPASWAVPYSGVLFVTLAAFLNTAFGRVVQEHVAETVSDAWRAVRVNLVPGLIHTILDLFRWLGSWLERGLYAVDEWLRYRQGQGKPSLVMKAVLGLVWFPVAYVVRFAFYLLLEPQINPVKHFPVVTVSHKLLLPMIPGLAGTTRLSEGVVATVVSGVPGIFGFIAWEVKENWRLYRANRGDRLGAAALGGHGETMRGLLRPGFHSGTVPKVRRKLRRAVEADDPGGVGRCHHDLEHTAEAVHRFVGRELVPLLRGRSEWAGLSPAVGHVRLGAQRAEVDLAVSELGAGPLVLAFENVDGRVDAQLGSGGVLERLSPPQRAVLLDAVRGVFDMAAVETVAGRERKDPGPSSDDPADALRPHWRRDAWEARWEGGAGKGG